VPASAPQFTLKLQAFEGPLDLLLHLVRSHEVDLHQISIAEVARQFASILRGWQELDLAVAGEYLLMAATLVQIKSRMILPNYGQPEEPGSEPAADPREQLVQQLIEHQALQEIVQTLQGREEQQRFALGRPETVLKEILKQENTFLEVNLFDLLQAYNQMLRRKEAESYLEVAPEPVSVKETMRGLLTRLREQPEVDLLEQFRACRSRIELIVTFLAVLELLRLGLVQVAQVRPLGEILVRRRVAAEQAEEILAREESDFDKKE
jgi:segregation and condensation protein A